MSNAKSAAGEVQPSAKRGRTWAEMFPDRLGVLIGDGHVDSITGPRCMVQMSEGPYVGRYIIAHTDSVLSKGDHVLCNDSTGCTRARLRDAEAEGHSQAGTADAELDPGRPSSSKAEAQ